MIKPVVKTGQSYFLKKKINDKIVVENQTKEWKVLRFKIKLRMKIMIKPVVKTEQSKNYNLPQEEI